VNTYLHGLDVLGGDVIGLFDIQAEQKQMNALKPVTVRVAHALLAGGQTAINGAIAAAKQPFYKADLPGATARDNVMWKLKWHEATLAPLTGDPNRLYSAGEDLKKWTMQAFIEANAVQEGAAYLEQAWTQMWVEIGQALAAIPAEVRQALIKAASGAVQAVTGLPLWAWGAIAVGGTAALGFIAYKFANTRAGGAVGGVVARRYIG
jgi:hypothetical protein